MQLIRRKFISTLKSFFSKARKKPPLFSPRLLPSLLNDKILVLVTDILKGTWASSHLWFFNGVFLCQTQSILFIPKALGLLKIAAGDMRPSFFPFFFVLSWENFRGSKMSRNEIVSVCLSQVGLRSKGIKRDETLQRPLLIYLNWVD